MPQSVTLGVLLLYLLLTSPGLVGDVHTPVVDLLPGAAPRAHHSSAHLPGCDPRLSREKQIYFSETLSIYFNYIKPVDDDVLDNGGVVCDASVTHFHVNDPEEVAQTLAVITFS